MLERKDLINAQFVDTFYPNIDGVVRTVHNYASEMNKYTYSAVVAPGEKNYTDQLDYDVFRVTSAGLASTEYRVPSPYTDSRLRRNLAARDYKIYHCHSPFLICRYGLKRAHRKGIPCVATFHSKYYDDILNFTHSPMIARQMTSEIVRFYESADAVWAVNSGTAETLRSYGYKGKLEIMENGTDYEYPEDPSSLMDRARWEFGVPFDRHVILFVGHQIWHKGLKLVLDSAEILKKQGFPFVIYIAGAGYDAEAIREYSDRKHLTDTYVRFIGQVADMDLMKGLYLLSDLFYFPSVYDNAPLVLREAAAMELPSLLIRGCNAAEKTVDGENGFLCENDAHSAAERILKAFESEPIREIGRRARETIVVPWSDIVPKVLDRYGEIIDEYAFLKSKKK